MPAASACRSSPHRGCPKTTLRYIFPFDRRKTFRAATFNKQETPVPEEKLLKMPGVTARMQGLWTIAP